MSVQLASHDNPTNGAHTEATTEPARMAKQPMRSAPIGPEMGCETLASHAAAAAAATRWHARAAWHLLDWIGCAAAGSVQPPGRVFADWLQAQPRGAVPTLAGRGADAAAAATFHGALGSALEMDDVHRSSILHPGPVVIPAALAACGVEASGATLLSALLSGYETMIRVGRALGPSHYRFWHSTATAGSFGAAAAAAHALGLDRQQTAHALGLAGTRSGGLWQVRHEESLGKAWHMAGAARDGLAAAQLAHAGLTGPLAVLDGPSGWFAATAPEADAGALGEPRSEPWLLDVSFKPWAACRHAHPAIDAAMVALAGAARTEPPSLIDVHSYADALRFCDRVQPQTPAQARFSIQHALAAWWHHGEPALEHYEAAAINDPRVATLRPRVHLHIDAAIDARFPAQYGARVELQWADGRRCTGAVADTLGDPARPLSPAALQAKARALMRSAGWREARIDAAIAVCADLPAAPDLHALAAVLTGEAA